MSNLWVWQSQRTAAAYPPYLIWIWSRINANSSFVFIHAKLILVAKCWSVGNYNSLSPKRSKGVNGMSWLWFWRRRKRNTKTIRTAHSRVRVSPNRDAKTIKSWRKCVSEDRIFPSAFPFAAWLDGTETEINSSSPDGPVFVGGGKVWIWWLTKIG